MTAAVTYRDGLAPGRGSRASPPVRVSLPPWGPPKGRRSKARTRPAVYAKHPAGGQSKAPGWRRPGGQREAQGRRSKGGNRPAVTARQPAGGQSGAVGRRSKAAQSEAPGERQPAACARLVRRVPRFDRRPGPSLPLRRMNSDRTPCPHPPAGSYRPGLRRARWADGSARRTRPTAPARRQRRLALISAVTRKGAPWPIPSHCQCPAAAAPPNSEA